MTQREVVEIASIVAKNEGWRLRGPLRLERRPSLFGNGEWLVLGRGPTDEHRSWVRIDARTGEVIATGWRIDATMLRAA